jgi:uncharacterized protein (DUF1501 family)
MPTSLDRRTLLRAGLAAPFPLQLPALSHAAVPGRTVVLVELAGGNDGLNTVVPFASPAYAAARPRLAVPSDQVLRLDERGQAARTSPRSTGGRPATPGASVRVGWPSR